MKLAAMSKCSGCSACKAACFRNAIQMQPDAEGFLRPVINEESCVRCGACERACPILHPKRREKNATCYIAKTHDEFVRKTSSSGGVFTELAKWVLAKEGVVFGCVWERPSLIAIHQKITTEAELAEMRGSKYVQSDLRNTFREAKEALSRGTQVLFSGTPCQIAGLNKYLGKTFDNLITVEVICHGAPSPIVFEQYKKELKERYGEPITEISFKDKRVSWQKPSLVVYFSNGLEHVEDAYSGMYGRSFLTGMIVRPSCYSCAAKEGKSGADFTLGDFWGIDKISPNEDNKKGVSCVLLHSKKARMVWRELCTMEMREVEYEVILKSNKSYWSPIIQHWKRAQFFKNFQQMGIDGSVKKYVEFSFLEKKRRKILRKWNSLKRLLRG